MDYVTDSCYIPNQEFVTNARTHHWITSSLVGVHKMFSVVLNETIRMKCITPDKTFPQTVASNPYIP